MSFNVACPHCGQVMECNDEWAGQQVCCPACGQVINLPINSVPVTPVVPPPPVQPPQYGAPQMVNPQAGYPQGGGIPGQQQGQQRPRFTSYLAESIIATIFCCMPLGIVSIVFSSIANGMYNSNRLDEAYKKAKLAHTLNLISLLLAIIWVVVYFIVLKKGKELGWEL